MIDRDTENREYQIKINGLRLYAYHGVFPEENKLGQEFKINLLLTVSYQPPLKDDTLGQVLSYWDAMETVKELFTGKTFKLLETAAHVILEGLAKYPQIHYAKIHLQKLTPPIPVTVENVGVIMDRYY